ncbi:MAG: UDP-N-acetylmuramoyl-L-alanine--D-glutamate ligase [Deltaproteobacteria bacterium]|nr:UDP-N-acetylmuramoyl-L-alanine--D-glutamate ligase [Deltaproteobacteria bacterium]
MAISAPDLQGKRVLVVGLGRSGQAVAKLCAAKGALVTVTDKKPAADLATQVAGLPPGVQQELGGHNAQTFLSAELIVLSPGVPHGPELLAAQAAGVKITGELELASRFTEGTIIGITGTNGKSTTTTLCGVMCKGTGRPTFVGGNLGTPLSEAVGSPATSLGGLCVIEVSSFQAETFEHFRPQVAVLLNISPDHLDRHRSVDSYVEAKAKLFAAQRESDFAVMNLDDPLVAQVARKARAHWIAFSTRQALTEGGWLQGDNLCIRVPGGEIERYPAETPRLVGRHNQENALAALLAARLAGALPAEVHRGLVGFRPLPHRMELVAKVHGVQFFDDSKGTNVGSAVAALTGFPRPVVLIAGGRHKGGSYSLLAETMSKVGRGAVLIGEAADQIEAAFADVVPVKRASSMEEAVRMAANLAQAGDAVVLSPACSSFDMFRDYNHRGEVFAEATRTLEKEAEELGSEPHLIRPGGA